MSASRNARDKLTIKQFCEEMQIPRSTFYAWRAKGLVPRLRKLPNGEIRITRADMEDWFESFEAA